METVSYSPEAPDVSRGVEPRAPEGTAPARGPAAAGTPVEALVTITLRVLRVPDTTPTGAALFLAGDHNGWDPADPASRLVPAGDGTWLGRVRGVPDTTLELKITRGSWDTVEKGPRGEELLNRFVAMPSTDSCISLRVASWRDQVPPRVELLPPRGTITVLDHFAAPSLGATRRIWVYLPPGYDHGTQRYPVLYMHDGQNVFDAATSFVGEWQVDEALDRLREEARLPGLIVVAVDNAGPGRLDEYSPFHDARLGKGGRGEAYVSFLVETLKPFIDNNFRTRRQREHTGVAGSSMGGLISLYAAFRHPETFSRVGALSPSLDFARGALGRFIRRTPRPDGMRIWLDMGGREGGQSREDRAMVDVAVRFHGLLLERGLSTAEVRLVVDPVGVHHELSWAKRFPEVATWLFAS